MGIERDEKDVTARKIETNSEYRTRMREERTRIPTRHENLMETKFNRDDPIEVRERDEEMDLFAKRADQIEAKIQAELAEIKANTQAFKARQVEYDRSRGAYESRTFLEATLRLKGIEPVEDIVGMKAQYEDWKARTSGAELPRKPRSLREMVRTHGRNTEAVGVSVA